MRQLAREEHAAVGDRIAELEQSVRLALLPRDEADDRDAVLEVRAGTGGEEAMLFAGVLVEMYRPVCHDPELDIRRFSAGRRPIRVESGSASHWFAGATCSPG